MTQILKHKVKQGFYKAVNFINDIAFGLIYISSVI